MGEIYFKPLKVKYKYLNRPGPGRTFKTKKSAINFNKIRANQKVLFTVQGVTGQDTFGSIGKIEAQTRKLTRFSCKYIYFFRQKHTYYICIYVHSLQIHVCSYLIFRQH